MLDEFFTITLISLILYKIIIYLLDLRPSKLPDWHGKYGEEYLKLELKNNETDKYRA